MLEVFGNPLRGSKSGVDSRAARHERGADARPDCNVACAYARIGEFDQAIDCLEQSIASGMKQVEWFENDPDLEPLREHGRYKALLKKVRADSEG